MEIVDYTGKLNNHNDYIEILNKIEKICSYIEIVLIDGKETNELVESFKEDILSVKKVNKWWGTEILGEENNYLYQIKSSKEVFDYLRKFETFCKYYECGTNEKSIEIGDYSERTDFGIDDIAFYDNENNYILYTTTHEGYIFINNILI